MIMADTVLREVPQFPGGNRGYYNFSNPASLTAIPYKTINFDFGFRGRISKFKVPGVDTLTAPSKDFIVKRATLAFKVTPTVAFAFGIKPFSSINYKYQLDGTATGGGADLTKSTDVVEVSTRLIFLLPSKSGKDFQLVQQLRGYLVHRKAL